MRALLTVMMLDYSLVEKSVALLESRYCVKQGKCEKMSLIRVSERDATIFKLSVSTRVKLTVGSLVYWY
jgi:hypothetical protein